MMNLAKSVVLIGLLKSGIYTPSLLTFPSNLIANEKRINCAADESFIKCRCFVG